MTRAVPTIGQPPPRVRRPLNRPERRRTGTAFKRARGDGPEALSNVLRFDEAEGKIARVRGYSFCCDTLRAIAEDLGYSAWTGLYRAQTPAPGKRWPGEGAARRLAGLRGGRDRGPMGDRYRSIGSSRWQTVMK